MTDQGDDRDASDPRSGSSADDSQPSHSSNSVVTPDEQVTESQRNRVDERVQALAQSAIEDRESFELTSDLPDEEQAMEILREGFGPAVWVYVKRHTGEQHQQFGRAELALLQRAMNDWLELYARCYGVELDAQFTVREAAKLLIETRNVKETAQLLTHVPGR